jgi:hypothetical protein
VEKSFCFLGTLLITITAGEKGSWGAIFSGEVVDRSDLTNGGEIKMDKDPD